MRKVLLLTVALALLATAWGCSSSKNDSDGPNNVKSAIIPTDTKAIFVANNSNLGNGSIFNKSIASDIGDINLVSSILYGINEVGKTSEVIFRTPKGNVRAQVLSVLKIGNTNKYYELHVDNFIAVDGVRDANGYIASNSGYDGRQLLMDKAGRIYDLSSVGCNNLQKRNVFGLIEVVGDNAYGICDSLEYDATRFKIELPTMKSAKVNEGMILNRNGTTDDLDFTENFVTFNSGDLLVFDTNSVSVFPGSEFQTEIPYHLGLDTTNLTQYLNFKMPAGVNPIFYTYNITDGTGTTSGTKYSETIAAKNPATLTDTDVKNALTVFFTEAKATGLSSAGQVYGVNIENRYESPIVAATSGGTYTCPNTGTGGALDTNNCYKATSYLVLYHISLQDRTIVRKEIANKKLETTVGIYQVKDNRVYWKDNITTGAVRTPYLRWLDLSDGTFGERVNVENLPLDGGPATFLAYTDNGKIYSRDTTNASSITRRDFYYVKDDSAVTPVPFYTATDIAVINVPTDKMKPLFGNIIYVKTEGTSGNSAIQLVDCSTGDIKASINGTYTIIIDPLIF